MRNETRSVEIWIAILLLWLIGGVLIFVAPEHLESRRTELIALGASFITSGFVAVALERVSIRAISRSLERIVSESMGELTLREQGLLRAHDSTPYHEILPILKRDNSLTIVQTWCPQLKRILSASEKLIANRGRITIYLLHPDSAIASQRSRDLRVAPEHVPNSIKGNRLLIHAFFNEMKVKYGNRQPDLSTRIELRYYSGLPTCAVYKTPKRAWIALYWHKEQSDDLANISVKPGSPLMNIVEDQIDRVHECSVSVPLDVNEVPEEYQYPDPI